MNLFENLQKLNETEFYGKDKKTGLEYGINADGDLYLGDSESGYNLKDTPENRDKILRDFKRYTEGINLNENSYSLVFNEFVEYLKSNNAQYIVDNLNETEFGLEFDIYNGDWKHEHQYIKNLIYDFYMNKGYSVDISGYNIDEDEDELSDTYSYHYNVTLTKNLKESTKTANEDELKNFLNMSINDCKDKDSRFEYDKKLNQLITTYFEEYNNIFPKDATEWDKLDIKYNVSKGKFYNKWYNFAKKCQELSESGKYNVSGYGRTDFITLQLKEKINAVHHTFPYGWKQVSRVTEASYGGAFDIVDDQYFTRDDLDEFADYVMEEVSKLSKYDWIPNLVDIYLEDNQALEMSIEYNDCEYTYSRDIDMRRIKTPRDLITKYASEYITYFYNEMEKNEEADWND